MSARGEDKYFLMVEQEPYPGDAPGDRFYYFAACRDALNHYFHSLRLRHYHKLNLVASQYLAGKSSKECFSAIEARYKKYYIRNNWYRFPKDVAELVAASIRGATQAPVKAPSKGKYPEGFATPDREGKLPGEEKPTRRGARPSPPGFAPKMPSLSGLPQDGKHKTEKLDKKPFAQLPEPNKTLPPDQPPLITPPDSVFYQDAPQADSAESTSQTVFLYSPSLPTVAAVTIYSPSIPTANHSAYALF